MCFQNPSKAFKTVQHHLQYYVILMVNQLRGCSPSPASLLSNLHGLVSSLDYRGERFCPSMNRAIYESFLRIWSLVPGTRPNMRKTFDVNLLMLRPNDTRGLNPVMNRPRTKASRRRNEHDTICFPRGIVRLAKQPRDLDSRLSPCLVLAKTAGLGVCSQPHHQ